MLEVVESEILCWEVRLWVKLIAWIQIILNVLGVAACVTILLCVGFLSYSDFDGDKIRIIVLAKLIYIYTIMLLGDTTIGLMFGIILIKGARERKTSYLRCWKKYAIYSFVLHLLTGMFVMGRSSQILALLIIILFSLPVFTFSIWTVRLLIFEITVNNVRAQVVCPHRHFPIDQFQLQLQQQIPNILNEDRNRVQHSRLVQCQGQGRGQDLPPSYYSLFSHHL